MSYLKTGRARIESLDETVDLVELNALGQKAMIDAHSEGDMFTATAVVVKYGTTKWRDVSVEEIMDTMSLTSIQEIAEKVTALSGLDDSKKSESTSGGDFFSS